MKKYNCIAVFNADRSKVLFCKRVKEPYTGRYNFVGGKVEAGETGEQAAYRELQEETGISDGDIQLSHLMDLTYYGYGFMLEIYIGQLRREMTLKEELNPLLWLPLTENFTDTYRFAGEHNIAHIMYVARQYIFRDEMTDGADACGN